MPDRQQLSSLALAPHNRNMVLGGELIRQLRDSRLLKSSTHPHGHGSTRPEEPIIYRHLVSRRELRHLTHKPERENVTMTTPQPDFLRSVNEPKGDESAPGLTEDHGTTDREVPG